MARFTPPRGRFTTCGRANNTRLDESRQVDRGGSQRDSPRHPASGLLTRYLLCRLRNQLPLKSGSVELIGGRLPLPLTTRDRGGAMRAPARDLIVLHLSLEAVGEADDDEP